MSRAAAAIEFILDDIEQAAMQPLPTFSASN